MTPTLHTQNKMADSIYDLYLVGEDFEAILDTSILSKILAH